MPLSIEELVKDQNMPLIEGDKATFVWKGRDAPHLIGDFTDWEDGKPVRMSRLYTGQWTVTLSFPRDAYIEYAFQRHSAVFQDPLNERAVDNGVGRYNSYFYMPEAAPTTLIYYREDIPHGELTKHRVGSDEMTVRGSRVVHLYDPPVDDPTPLLVVLDGSEYLHRASLCVIVDNLIAQKRIRPISIAFVNNGKKARTVEYMCNEASLWFLLQSVLPLAQQNLYLTDLDEQPGAYGILGSSLGGLMALFAGLRLPHIFGHILSQSGAFAHEGRKYVVYPLVEKSKHLPLKIWMEVGRYEDLLATNREMAALLQSRSDGLIYREYPGGHNFTCWQNEVWRGLEYLYGNQPGE